MRVTKRGLQLTLGALWLFDAALQFQPFMFTRGFAHDIVAPTAIGQPAIVGGPVRFAAHLIAAQPVAINAVFAVVQLGLAVALFYRRTARVALIASIGWSVAVWWLGEGLGGLFSGHAMLLTGAPGAVALYGVLALVAYPSRPEDGRGEQPSRWAVGGWAAIWATGALLQALPGQNRADGLSSALHDSARAAPGWLAHPTNGLANSVGHHSSVGIALIALELLVAVSALVPGAPRLASVVTGAALAAGFWVFGQGFGDLSGGQATDPNSGPLLLALAVAVGAVRQRRVSRAPIDSPFPLEPAPQFAAVGPGRGRSASTSRAALVE